MQNLEIEIGPYRYLCQVAGCADFLIVSVLEGLNGAFKAQGCYEFSDPQLLAMWMRNPQKAFWRASLLGVAQLAQGVTNNRPD